MLRFKEWIAKKDELKSAGHTNVKKQDDSTKESGNAPSNQSIKIVGLKKPTTEGKEIARKMTMKKLRESLGDYVDQIVPSKPPEKQR
jgi:hypothetical protein